MIKINEKSDMEKIIPKEVNELLTKKVETYLKAIYPQGAPLIQAQEVAQAFIAGMIEMMGEKLEGQTAMSEAIKPYFEFRKNQIREIKHFSKRERKS